MDHCVAIKRKATKEGEPCRVDVDAKAAEGPCRLSLTEVTFTRTQIKGL